MVLLPVVGIGDNVVLAAERQKNRLVGFFVVWQEQVR
jgi:hypothetical protein